MFNEMHKSNNNADSTELVFISSANIQAYPCGRRRSQQVSVDQDGNGQVEESEKYYIPFDPEARLNTEANNRKHSSLNGYTQTYIEQWSEEDGLLNLSLGGYLFSISLAASHITPSDFGQKIVSKLTSNEDDADVKNIYANILIEETPLFSGFKDYNTWVLRNQSDSKVGEACLDLLNAASSNGGTASIQAFENYYFSGISFSTSPLTKQETTRSFRNVTIEDGLPGSRPQQIISLCLLDKYSETVSGKTYYYWRIHEPARLPFIEHGESKDSVKVVKLEAESIEQNGIPVPSMTVYDAGDGTFQLQFSFGTKSE